MTFRVIFSFALIFFATDVLGQNKALIIGIGDYPDSESTPSDLPGIDIDVENARQVALWMGYRQSEIVELTNERARSSEILGEIRRMARDIDEDGRALIYFSGHGSYQRDRNGDEADGWDEVLVPYDAKANGSTLKNVIVDDELGDLLRSFKTDNLLVMIDACHSGTAAELEFAAKGIAAGTIVEKYWDHNPEARRAATSEISPAQPRSVGLVEVDSDGEFVAIAASLDEERALATDKGSLFTLGLYAYTSGKVGESITPAQLHEGAYEYTNDVASGHGRSQRPQIAGPKRLTNAPLGLQLLGNDGPVRRALVDLVEHPQAQRVGVRADANYRIGEEIIYELEIPESVGKWYLNVVTVGPTDVGTVLFPNKYFYDNTITIDSDRTLIGEESLSADNWMEFPTPEMRQRKFRFQAIEPLGETLTVAIWSRERLNLHVDNQAAISAAGKPIFADSGQFTMALISPGRIEAAKSVGLMSAQRSRIGAVELKTHR